MAHQFSRFIEHDATMPMAPEMDLKPAPVRILHVEDDEFIADMVKEILALEGWHVETRDNGVAALMTIAGDTPYDLILLDNDLPEIAGVEILRQTRSMSHRSWVPIVMLSGNLDEPLATLSGADMCLRKPDDLPRLREALAQLLTSRRNGSQVEANAATNGR